MTHDERIEAMARAMRAADVEPRKFDAHWNVRHFDEQHDEAKAWWYRIATAALVAVGVEKLDAELAAERARADNAEQEAAALRADAERWRWWRDHHGWSGYFDDGATNSEDPSKIDAAIDAERREEA
jgi:hypothetical protein